MPTPLVYELMLIFVVVTLSHTSPYYNASRQVTSVRHNVARPCTNWPHWRTVNLLSIYRRVGSSLPCTSCCWFSVDASSLSASSVHKFIPVSFVWLSWNILCGYAFSTSPPNLFSFPQPQLVYRLSCVCRNVTSQHIVLIKDSESKANLMNYCTNIHM